MIYYITIITYEYKSNRQLNKTESDQNVTCILQNRGKHGTFGNAMIYVTLTKVLNVI